MKKFIITSLLIVLFILNLSLNVYGASIDNSSLKNSIKNVNSYLKNNIDYNQPEYLTEILDENGNVPAYSYYPKHVSSRGIKSLKAFNGKIFMGLGDWNDNTGPVKILYYDTKSKKIVSTGTIADEAVETFHIIDNTLYTTGTDPKAAWGYGSYYQYNETDNKWEQHQNNNGWKHIFNIIKFDDKLFLCGSVNGKQTPIQYSEDNGNTFKYIYLYQDNTQLTIDGNLRCYNLISFNNNLYAFVASSGTPKYNGIYKYDSKEDKFNYISKALDNSAHFYARFPKHSSLGDKFIFLSGTHLYSTTDLKEFKPILINLYGQTIKSSKGFNTYVGGTETSAQDSLVIDDTLYLLSYKSDKSSYIARIFSTKDLSTTKLVYEFKTSSPPYSFEYYDGSFYVGTNVGYSSGLGDSVKNRKFI